MQVVTSSPGNLGINPSGVGAVIFDSTVDPLKLHEENLKLLDEGAQQRAAQRLQKTALAYKMVGDLNPDVKGIMDTDADYFRQRASELSGFQSKLFGAGLNPENPAFGDAYSKGQYAKNSLDIDVQASVAQKQALMDAVKEFGTHPELYDDKQTTENIAAFRAKPFEQRKGLDMSKLLIKKKDNLSDIIGGEVDKFKLKPVNVADEGGKLFHIETVNGNDLMVQQTETLPLRAAADAHNALYTSNPKYKNALNDSWAQIEGTKNEDYYTNLAQQYKAQGLPVYNAKDAYATQQWGLFNQKDKNITSLGNNIYAVDALKDNEDAKEAEGLYLNAVNTVAGNPKIITPGYYESQRTDETGKPLVITEGGVSAPNPFAGNKKKIAATEVPQYQGANFGSYSTVDEKGNPKTEKNIIQHVFRGPNGTIQVVTTQSQDLYKKGALPVPYTEYKTPIEWAIAQVQASPADERDASKKDKILGHLYEVEKKYNQKYGNNYVAQAGLTPEDIQKRDEIMKADPNQIYVPIGATQQPTTKTAATTQVLTGKSNSGKDIYSDDGGKTWKYK